MGSSAVWVFLALEMIIAVASCCLGNALVIWAVWTCGALRQPTFCFIVSLAVADFLVGLVAIPITVLVDIGMTTSFYGCLFMCCVIIMLEVASVVLLLAIAVDRFLRVHIPLTLLRANIGVAAVSNTYYQREHRLAASLVLVLVLFVVCWLPLFLTVTVRLYGHNIEVSSVAIDMGVLLSHANPVVNPIVYAFKIPKIKEAITNFLLDPPQFVYRANRSVDVVNMALHFMLQHLNSPGTYIRVLFVDFSSVFNTTAPELLQIKLSVPDPIC
ncbi:adenosine receptor A1-like [Pygocentrus nattereri]|uniref:adenosine receptor A1-like n=1 Tax=Pygocentrus nattereri TaxID=42514 RepID=UPI0018911213|nr:adenosine receptor A1-like [Pygocentrus nattereri]